MIWGKIQPRTTLVAITKMWLSNDVLSEIIICLILINLRNDEVRLSRTSAKFKIDQSQEQLCYKVRR